MAKLSEVFEKLNAAAPKALSDEFCARFGAYDNSGVLVDTDGEVTGAVFSLDLTDAAIDKAIAEGKNLIVTHHPAIYQKLPCLLEDGLGAKVLRCARHGIGVVSMHLNLDCALGGVDESLAFAVQKAAGGAAGETVLMHEVGEGGAGYGRAFDVKRTDFSALCEGLKKELNAKNVYAFDAGRVACRVASFCGAGADEDAVAFALSQGVDVVVSSDFKHHILLSLVEAGVSVIAPTHYAAEAYGFKKYYEKISQSIALPCAFCADERLL